MNNTETRPGRNLTVPVEVRENDYAQWDTLQGTMVVIVEVIQTDEPTPTLSALLQVRATDGGALVAGSILTGTWDVLLAHGRREAGLISSREFFGGAK